MNLLYNIKNLLSVGHKEAIKNIFEALKKSSLIRTSRETQFEAERLVKKISSISDTFAFTPIYFNPGDKISSISHNENMENISIDLNGVCKQTANIVNIQNKFVDTTQDSLNKAKAAIFKLINDARIYTIRNKYPEYDDIKLINFNIATNNTKKKPSANIDQDTRLLKLPYVLNRRVHLQNRNNKNTYVKTNLVSTGQKGYLSLQFEPVNAIDQRPETFWSESVYYDDVPESVYNRWSANSSGSFTDLVKGPIIKYTLQFSSVELINQIKILPFSDFPVKILEITYRPNVASLIRISIPEFQSEESLDWVEFNFSPVYAYDIEIVLAQEHYRSYIINVPKHILYSTDFLTRLYQEKNNNNVLYKNLYDNEINGNIDIYQEAIKDLADIISNKELEKTPTTEISLAGKTILSYGEALSLFNPNVSSLLEDVSAYTNELPTDVSNQIETFNKIEYIIGARSIECNYIIYSPIGFYESEKLQPASTVSNAVLYTEEKHPTIKSKWGNYKLSSSEWEIEFSEDKKLPILPRSTLEGNNYKVTNEYLDVNTIDFSGTTRFKANILWANVREGEQLLTPGQDYSIQFNNDGKIVIKINLLSFNKNKIYTIDYIADPSSTEIDVFNKFKDKKITVPESFENTDSNNAVTLKYYPFINYTFINSNDFKYSSGSNAFQYTPPQSGYTTGHIVLFPNWTQSSGNYITTITGSTLAYGLTGAGTTVVPNWSILNSAYFTSPYSYYVKINNIPDGIYKIASFTSATGLVLDKIPTVYTGLVGNEIPAYYFSGNITGDPGSSTQIGVLRLPYKIEVVYENNEQVFGFDNILYTPINISIGGIKAKNITNYLALEQPAFTVSNNNDTEYQYIHDGKTMYFNQPINDTEILVDYRWMTKYVKINCVLRSHKLITPNISPQINEYSLLLNTTIL